METQENALKLMLQHTMPITETQTVSLMDALGRVAAEEISSPINVPPFDRSPLDGYALHSEDLAGATKENPAHLRVIGEACAGCGEIFHPGKGEVIRIMTGAPVPSECDCVIRQEDTDEGMETAAFYTSLKHGENVCRAGEDIRKGEVLVQKGDLLTSAHIGVLASLGVCEVLVYRRARVTLLSTGDEIVRPGQPLTFGKIYDSNAAILTARLMEIGVSVKTLQPECDDPEHVAMVIDQVLDQSDIVITTGGVSVGKKDIFHQVLPILGAERLFWKIAMKPGSPMMAGIKNDTLILCLSGNPFAALACFEIFGVPILKKLSGNHCFESRRVRTRFSGCFGKASKGRRIVRAFFDGECVRLTGGNHSNGSLATMIGCNCLIDIPAGSGALKDGDEVEIILL